MDFNDF